MNRLTFIHELPRERDKNGKLKRKQGLYKCECGNKKEARIAHVKSGNIKSCGCLGPEKASLMMSKHGLSKHPIYSRWHSMIRRCYNSSHKLYHRYGGRGIEVCDEWKDDPEDFIDWCMSNGYEKGLQIDRKDNDGNYTPDNCRFVTPAENMQNSTQSKLDIEKVKEIRKKFGKNGNNGVSLAKEYGVDNTTIYSIIKLETWKDI